ncbi:response regulator [Myxococcota bacterium]|nr:response regulator [Myxococcota bacterium]MBU1497828.1 response regulator [Myxococcota bacterium]
MMGFYSDDFLTEISDLLFSKNTPDLEGAGIIINKLNNNIKALYISSDNNHLFHRAFSTTTDLQLPEHYKIKTPAKCHSFSRCSDFPDFLLFHFCNKSIESGYFLISDMVITPEFEDRIKLISTLITAALNHSRNHRILKENKKFRTLIENASVGIITIDSDGKILDINEKLVEILGSPSAEETKKINVFTYPLLVEAGISDDFIKCWTNKTNGTFEHSYRTKWGKQVYLRYSLTPMTNPDSSFSGLMAIMEDISTQKIIDERIQHFQRMEAISNFTAGIAHDFNNILEIILGSTELIFQSPEDHVLISEQANTIKKIARRGRNIISQLLAFSHHHREEKITVNLHELIEDCLDLVKIWVPSNIKIELRPTTNPAYINADQTQIQQVILNLVSNASYAIGNASGRISIDITKSTLKNSRSNDDISYVLLSIADNGKGMTNATMKRIFEPYFTTRTAESGTGLGLSVVWGIIDNHEGIIEVNSEVGTGTEFRLYFPEASPPLKTYTSTSQGRLILLDDELDLVKTWGQILEKVGYKVNTFTNPIRALNFFKTNADNWDLIITDQTMSGMNGLEFSKEIKKIRTDIPVILCTGYGEKLDGEPLSDMGINEVVIKPIGISGLIKIIKKYC